MRILNRFVVCVVAWGVGAVAGGAMAGGVLAQAGDTLSAVPIAGEAFVDARGIAVDPRGFIYVADAGRDVVIKLSPEGDPIATIGGPGSREGEFDEPSAIDPTNGLILYVADAGNHRIQLFSRSFAYLGSIPLVRTGEESSARVTYGRRDEEAAAFPNGVPVSVARAGSGELYAVDSDRRVVLMWNENRRLVRVIGDVDAGEGRLAEPVDVSVGPEALVYVADRAAGSIVTYDSFGTFVRAIGRARLAGIRSVAVSGEYVYAGLPRAVEVYDLTGRFQRRLELEIPEDVVDVSASTGGTLYVLGRRRAYRVEAD